MTGFRLDRNWPSLTQVEKHAAVQLLATQQLTKERIADRLGCDVKTVWRYSQPAAVPPGVREAVAARFQTDERRRSLKRETDAYPARA